MPGHPRGIYWNDMVEAQRTAAQSLGFTQKTWDEGAPPPVVDAAAVVAAAEEREQEAAPPVRSPRQSWRRDRCGVLLSRACVRTYVRTYVIGSMGCFCADSTIANLTHTVRLLLYACRTQPVSYTHLTLPTKRIG